MGGSKKNRKKPISPLPPTEIMNEDDSELMDDLLAQLDSRDQVVQAESASVLNEMNLNAQADSIEASSRQDAKSRFKARQARKAAALAQSYSPDDPAVQARLEKEARDEEDSIRRVCDQLSLEIHEINPDGHCLFSAVADQLALLGLISPAEATYTNLRVAAANYIHSHPDDFLPFLPSTGGEDGAGALDAGMMNREEFDSYCTSIRDTAIWGGEPEIVALSRAFNIPINVVQGGHPPIVVHSPAGDQKSGTATPASVMISYHRKLYGLGEHYNSLRKKVA
ncbi:OVARIAN TUMOR DOMAIN-containing deubiquitinating enzyme 5 [Psilocybe cubensis]|uniref:OTU domain-containing protein n=2 Tax=Psilocybe cubensis TaxID=181762 RepID=A0A8H8CNA4_PSICU|nr:OVARIAN TUMOR DOMAIN-containing deubiquitinating enzyme 5 [Psilocybe cubensis]KAH9484293.1 OVARIAN TUMOR DOMAIN-containing deubiquitinating enzyme 5 [Psilocybe cubensis]